MRVDVAPILFGMGFTPDVDFIAVQTSPTNTDVQWLSAQAQPTAAAIDTFAASNPNAFQNRLRDLRRTSAQALTTDASVSGVQTRAVVSVLVDEINLLRQQITQIKAAIAASSTIANLKTGVAAVPAVPDRTLAQAKTAYQNAIAGGTAD